MSNNHLANAGNPRPPSPPSRDDAELLRFVSQGIHSSAARASLPSLAPTSFVPFSSPYASMIAAGMNPAAVMNPVAAFNPADLAASQIMVTNNLVLTNSEAALTPQVPAAAKPGAAGSEVNETAEHGDNGKLHFSKGLRRHPCTNRPIDHTYTDYSLISDAELREVDQDSSVLLSPLLSAEKKALMLKLKDMPCKNAGATQSFPSKVCALECTQCT
jgi:hypothetical protein